MTRLQSRSPTQRRMLLCGLLSTTALATASPALAQGSEQAGAVEEVVVTAQKRTERLQDVPMSVTAVSGQALARQQIHDTTNLVAAVPALTFQQGTNPINTSFRIRGIGTSLFGLGVEASVSVVVDGVVSARQAQSFTDFADIERIEVLRGPQGTLFGKNATAGVINVVTARPSRQFGGNATATFAEGGEYRVAGSMTGPLTDNVSARVTGYYNKVGGYIGNVTGPDENGFESWGARLKLEWTPTDSLNILASADYRQNNAECCVNLFVDVTTPNLARLISPVVAGPTNRQVKDDGLSFSTVNQRTYSVQADWDLGWGTFTSLTAYQRFSVEFNSEADRIFTPQPVFVGGTGANNFSQFDLNAGQALIKQVSQEARVASDPEGRLTYVAGAYYSYLEIDRTFQRRRSYCAAGTVAQIGTPCTPTSNQSLAHRALLQSAHLAAFGQAEFKVVGGLKLTGGLRVQKERVSVEGQRLGPVFPGEQLFGGTLGPKAGKLAEDSVVTGKAGAQYEFSPQAQAYASYTRGYKGQGLDTEATADFANQITVQPEYVDAYEVGFKAQLLDRRLSVAAALFLADYTDLQVQANRSDTTTGTVVFIQTNAGSSTTKGFELETTFQPSDSFTVDAALTYAKAQIDIDGLNCPLQFQGAAPTIPFGGQTPINSCYRASNRNAAGMTVVSAPIQDIRGGDLPVSPRWRLNLSPRYTFDVGQGWSGAAQMNVAYQSRQIYAVEQDPLLTQGGYTLVDASLSVSRREDGLQFTVFVKNLFDKNFYTNQSHAGTLSSTTNATDLVAYISKNADRYFGATVDVRF